MTHEENLDAMKRITFEHIDMIPMWFIYVKMPDGKSLKLSPDDIAKLAEDAYAKHKKP